MRIRVAIIEQDTGYLEKITNVFNTITTNMSLRSKEFAVLKSIGMTEKQFKKMINYESLLYGLKH